VYWFVNVCSARVRGIESCGAMLSRCSEDYITAVIRFSEGTRITSGGNPMPFVRNPSHTLIRIPTISRNTATS
jgi:hypothetical protein